ncbi:MFS transporter [Halobaculum sp. MBLA0143]|uniref:MFS transporter n=1 Tax=Halobaculum sp. MBLA0143 TaxID=3079933 RepID=UPI0035252352
MDDETDGSLWRNVGFRRLFTGRLATNAGDSAYLIAALWLVFDLTGSSLYTGVAGFLIRGPRVLRVLAGPVVDRRPPHQILVWAQLLQGALVAVLAGTALLGELSVWLLLAVLPFVSGIEQFVSPAEKAVLPRLVDDERLVRANSLLSLAKSGTDVAFQAGSGVVLAVVGAASLFVFDAATFVLAAVLFAGVTVTSDTDDDTDPAETGDSLGDDGSSYGDRLRAGVGYIRGSRLVPFLLGAAAVNFGSGAMTAVLPELGAALGSASAFGTLMAALAASTLVGSVSATVFEDVPYGTVGVAAFLISGLSLAGAVAVSGLVGTAGLLFLAFVPVGVFNILFFSVIQSAADTEFVGRVSATVSSLTAATFPLGSLVGGAAAAVVGVDTLLYGYAGLLLLFGVGCLVDKGIRTLPPVTEADAETLGFGG